jgi:hypothetical protein
MLNGTDWEKQIVEHFINTNRDQKSPEPLRLVDMDNLDKYYSRLSDAQLKNEILFELLRSAANEHSRVNYFNCFTH